MWRCHYYQALNLIIFSIYSNNSEVQFFKPSKNSKKFVIKTLKDSELELLAKKGVLEKYYNHLNKNPKSLLARFYAVLKVKIKFMQPINIIIMDNLMGEHLEQAYRVYDLKGSTFNRISQNPSSDLSVRKDLNYLEDKKFRMCVSEKVRKDIMKRMEKDKEFLKACELMDYSVLLVFFNKTFPQQKKDGSWVSLNKKMSMVVRNESEGQGKVVAFEEIKEGTVQAPYPNIFGVSPSINAHQDNEEVPNEKSNSVGFDHLGQLNNSQGLLKINNPRTNEFIEYTSEKDANVYYRIGIIDFLQKYNRKKQLETKWLEYRNRNVAPDTFSCVHPKLYADRFYKFMQTNLFENDQK